MLTTVAKTTCVAVGTRFATRSVNDPLPESLAAALVALSACLAASSTPGIIIGGVAASLLGRPRLTRDIDVLVDLADERLQALLAVAQDFGIAPRIEHPEEFARRSRVLLLRHVASQIDIDLILGTLPFELEAVAAGQVRHAGPIEVRLPRVEDLMIMKAIAHRPRDMHDLEALLVAHPGADLTRAKQWVREFAIAATMPELIEDFERLIRETTARFRP